MNFNAYEEKFRFVAKRRSFSSYEIDACLHYSRALIEKGLPVIFDATHLSQLLGYQKSYLFGVANSPVSYYREFEIQKRSGAVRKIQEPLPSLKEIQRWILENILEKVQPSKFAKAFRRGYSIVDNARFHVGKECVVVVDIKDFFPSITFPRVYAQFSAMGYHKTVSGLLAKLCCYKDALPQGSPASPYLANLVAGRLDRRIASYALKRKILFTRYADDLTFSNVRDVGGLLRYLDYCVTTEGFCLKKEKTRVLGTERRQIVTGVVVNKKISPPRDQLKKMRQELYFLKKYGLESHLDRIGEFRPNYIKHLIGKVRHWMSIGLDTEVANSWLKQLKELQ